MGIRAVKVIRKNWELYLFVLPAVVYFILFHYFPMYGVQIAFKKFNAVQGIWGSDWVGFDHLDRFFNSYYFWTLIKNTFAINLYELVVGFPVPIILALALNEMKLVRFKKLVQTITYAPHFISVVVMSGIIIMFLSPSTGIINFILNGLGLDAIDFMSKPEWFKTIFVFSGVWQGMGWGTIIYLAALAGIDMQQHEAAMIDGATRMQRIWHINIPGILPTVVILLILNVGNFMAVGFEKIYLLQNSLNMEASDVISTYVYRSGVLEGQYSFSAAVGLFNSILNFILLILVNSLARKMKQTSLW
ncbi:ABC transporter permease [Paenibacillus sp. strain BS8-2]